jgi:hypothetical protein
MGDNVNYTSAQKNTKIHPNALSALFFKLNQQSGGEGARGFFQEKPTVRKKVLLFRGKSASFILTPNFFFFVLRAQGPGTRD